MSCSVCQDSAVFVAADRDAHAYVCAKDACANAFANGAAVIGVRRKGKEDDGDVDEVEVDSKKKRDDDTKTMDQEGIVSLADVAKKEYMQRLAQFDQEEFPYHKAGHIFDQFVLDENDCFIWEKYRILRFLGSGSYGMVFEVSNIPKSVTPEQLAQFTPETTKYYALKCESLSSRGSQGVQEIQSEVAINELLLRLDKKTTINVLHMHDWIRCRLTLSKRMPRDVFVGMAQRVKSVMFDAMTEQSDWQMMLLEDADHTLLEYANVWTALGRPDFDMFVSSVCVQVLCTLYLLQQKIDFRHGDMSVNNVMVMNSKKKIKDERFVVYHLVDRRVAYVVPLRYTGGMLAVLSDKGFSSARYSAGGVDNVIEITSNQLYARYPEKEFIFVQQLGQMAQARGDPHIASIVQFFRSFSFSSSDKKYRIDFPFILFQDVFQDFRHEIPPGMTFQDYVKTNLPQSILADDFSPNINDYHVIPIFEEEYFFVTPYIQAQRK